jgi:hypothetical protein
MTTEAEPERGAAAAGGGNTGNGGNAGASVASGAEAAATFAIEGEDHTLANALRFHLNKK